MKKKVIIALSVLAILAVYYLLGTDYLQQRQKQAGLNIQIADATYALAQMTRSPDDLEQKMTEAQAELADVEAVFPDEVNSTLVVNSILELAEAIGIKAIPLVTQPWSAETNGEHDYYVLRLNVSLAGSFSQFAKFTDELESNELATLIVERLSVTRDVATDDDEGTAVPTDNVTASLEVAVYTRSLPVDEDEGELSP